GSHAIGDAEQLRQAGIDLRGAKADGYRDAEQGAEHGEDIDGLANGAVDTLLDQRIEDGADAHRQVIAINEVGEGQARQGEDGPGVQAQMVEREAHGFLSGFYRVWCNIAMGRVGKME